MKKLLPVLCVLGIVICLFASSSSEKFEQFNFNNLVGKFFLGYNSDTKALEALPVTDYAKVVDVPTKTSQIFNDSGFLNVIPAQPWNSIMGKPTTIAGYGITDSYTDTKARNAISLTTTGSTGVSAYNAATGVLNVPNYSFTPTAPNYSNTPARTLNATGSILSTTKPTWVSYSITHTVALTLVTLNGASNVYLEISPNNTTWTTISQAGFSDGVAVAVAITKSQTNNIQGYIPANYYYRIRSVVTGGGSATFANGQEVTIN